MKLHRNIKECFQAGDSGDRWGSAMQVAFAICSELHIRDEPIPVSLGYSPGCADDPREPDGYEYELLLNVPSKDLYHAAVVYSRYLDFLKMRGEDY